MNSMERVLTTLGHSEPDQVPWFLLTTMHGAKELGLSIKDYFSAGKNVMEGQRRLQRKFQSDCYYPFFYASIETEAMGGDVIYIEDGPPNAGRPIIRSTTDIDAFEIPEVQDNVVLSKVYDAIKGLNKESNGEIPIIGVVMSPFSLPVMQMGFEAYLDLIYTDKAAFQRLMRRNEEFCVEYANAQLDAGATAICYYDPLSSTTNTTKEDYRNTGMLVAKRTLSRIKGPTATHMASGRSLPIVEDIASTSTAVLGVSALEDLADQKAACKGKMTVLGNLNGIEMRRWTAETAESKVKEAIRKAGRGGGFILSDNHGEIPHQVSEGTLITIRDAVQKWGRYPLDWVDEDEG